MMRFGKGMTEQGNRDRQGDLFTRQEDRQRLCGTPVCTRGRVAMHAGV